MQGFILLTLTIIIKINHHQYNHQRWNLIGDPRHHQELHQLRLQRRRLEEMIQVFIIIIIIIIICNNIIIIITDTIIIIIIITTIIIIIINIIIITKVAEETDRRRQEELRQLQEQHQVQHYYYRQHRSPFPSFVSSQYFSERSRLHPKISKGWGKCFTFVQIQWENPSPPSVHGVG